MQKPFIGKILLADHIPRHEGIQGPKVSDIDLESAGKLA